MSDFELNICNFFKLRSKDGQIHRYQNYFIGEVVTYKGESYDFIGFRAEGAVSTLNGDNQALRLLFPNDPAVVALVEAADGNRLSAMTLGTAWLDARDAIRTSIDYFFTGVGAGFSDETVELRFRSSTDAVTTGFPARTLTQANVGILPISSELSLR